MRTRPWRFGSVGISRGFDTDVNVSVKNVDREAAESIALENRVEKLRQAVGLAARVALSFDEAICLPRPVASSGTWAKSCQIHRKHETGLPRRGHDRCEVENGSPTICTQASTQSGCLLSLNRGS